MNDAPPSSWQLMRIVSEAQATLDRLRADEGLVVETDAELVSALAGEGMDVATILSRIGRAALDAKADVEAANTRLAHLTARRDRAARREETLRATLLQAMQALGMRAFRDDPEFSASVRAGKPRLHISEPDLPPAMVEARTVLSPDRARIRAALDAGEIVPGAQLGNAAPILTIKVT